MAPVVPTDGSPLSDATCPECGFTWVEASYAVTIYCPHKKHHMNYRVTKVPHLHCWDGPGVLANNHPHSVCCGCKQKADLNTLLRKAGIDPDTMTRLPRSISESNRLAELSPLAFKVPGDPEYVPTPDDTPRHPFMERCMTLPRTVADESWLGGLHRMVREGVDYNRAIEKERLDMQVIIGQHQASANNRVNGRRHLQAHVEAVIEKYTERWHAPFGVVQDLRDILAKIKNLDFTVHKEFK